MALTVHTLASGPGWQVDDVVCDHGPGERPSTEQHAGYSIAAVTQGTFQYRGTSGAATLVPGSFLLGNHRACFECGHEHAQGDRCVSFHFDPEPFEEMAADAEAAPLRFAAPSLPPLPQFARLFADAELARDERDASALENIALRLVGAVLATLSPPRRAAHRPSTRDERRVTDAVRRIEAHPDASWTLTRLAADAAMSRYHFLHTFRRVTGTTPHQFVLRTRLHHAALRLRLSGERISAIAFDAGFNDLATFNRRFQRVMGAAPGAYRARL